MATPFSPGALVLVDTVGSLLPDLQLTYVTCHWLLPESWCVWSWFVGLRGKSPHLEWPGSCSYSHPYYYILSFTLIPFRPQSLKIHQIFCPLLPSPPDPKVLKIHQILCPLLQSPPDPKVWKYTKYSFLYFNPLQTPKSENIPKQDSSNLLPYEDDKTRVDLRPQSRGQKQIAPRKDFISRHILFGIHSSFFNTINYFPTFKRLVHIAITPRFQNSLRKRRASLTLKRLRKYHHTVIHVCK